MYEPKISIIVPVKPGLNIDSIIDSLKQIDYPEEKFELIVVEGTKPSFQRNEGVKIASGEIIYFFDDDCSFPKDIFRKAMSHYQDSQTVAVAGVSLVRDNSPAISRAANMSLGSIFGGCTVRFKYRRIGNLCLASDKHFILCNASIRKDVYINEGGFREELYPGEENEFFRRLYAKGYKMVYDPDVIIYRNWRSKIRGYIKAIFIYGRAKVDQGFENYSIIDLVFFVPVIFLIYLVSIFFINNFYYRLPFYFYIFLVIFFTLVEIIRNKTFVGFLLLILFPLLHISFAIGMLWGFIKKYIINKFFYKNICPNKKNNTIKIKFIKTFDQKLCG